MASKGRGPDSMLIHMSPREVQGLQALAMKHGGSLTINPETGLPEAGFLDKLLPAIIGFGLNYFAPGLGTAIGSALGTSAAVGTGIAVGGVQALRTGSFKEGIEAGLGAYGGAGFGAGLAEAGASTIGAAEAAKGLTMSPELLAEFGGDSARDSLLQQQVTDRMAAATPYEKLSSGFDAFKNNPMGMTKSLAMPALAAAAPVLADQAVKSNLPTTTTRPGEVHRFSYNPYNQYYTPVGNYEVPVKSAAGGGLMGMNSNGYNPGELNFSGGGDPIVRMANGGSTVRMAGGTPPAMLTDEQLYQQTGDWNKAAELRDAQNNALNQYNWNQQAQAKVPELINQSMNNATSTQNALEAAKNYVNTAAIPTETADQFISGAQKANIGLTQELQTALANSGLSAASQYALTHQNIGPDVNKEETYGGLKGLSSNINYLANLANTQIGAGTLTPAQARENALTEMNKYGLNEADVLRATGKTVAELFKDKPIVQNPVVCGPGFKLSADGKSCVPDVQGPITCGPGFKLSADGKSCVPDVVTLPVAPSGFHYENGVLVPNISSTQNTTTTVASPTDLFTAPSTALPVGIAGNTGPSQIGGGATVNPNGTITTSPRIPGIPVGGFTGMEQVRDAYTKGGGKLGYTPTAPKTMDEFNAKYNKLTGGSKAAYDYLTGKTKYSPKPVTETGEIMKPYAESVLGVPMNKASKQYLYDPDAKKYTLNPDFIPVSYTSEGKKVYGLSSNDIAAQLPSLAKSDYEKFMADNNVTLAQIAQALNISLAEAKKRYPTAKDSGTNTATTDTNTSSESSSGTGGEANGGLMATGGLAALTMARGGTTHMPFFSKSTGKFRAAGPQVYADGGMSGQYDLGSYSDGGRLLRGPGDGVSDSIPATIGNKRPARLADGEFVVPARIVSELGNGSTEAGARKLYAMMDRVQAARKGSIGKGRVANNSRADKYLPV
jgi:hypothetical protein